MITRILHRILLFTLVLMSVSPLLYAQDELCTEGTLLFREDFGGNDPNDPRVGTTPVQGMTYEQLLTDEWMSMKSGKYLVTKSGYCNGDTSMTNLPQNRSSQWHLQDDHTYPNDKTRGYLMEIDGRGDHSAFYSTTIDGLCEGSRLTFSAYVANVLTWGMYVGSPGRYAYPRLKFVLTDPDTGALLAIYNTGDIPFDSTFINDYSCWKQSVKWQLVGMNFTVPSGQNKIRLTIYNNATGTTGNDFAIDDIEIRLCTPPVTIEGEAEVCPHVPTTLTANFTNDGTFPEPLAYKWFFSADSASWETLDETSNVLTIPNVQKADSGWYQVAVAGSEEIEYLRCRAISEPYLLKVKGCEPSKPVTVRIISPDSVCPNDPYTFEVEIENEDALQAPIEYQWWYRSPEQPDTWIRLSSGNVRNMHITSFQTQHVGWYKVMVAGHGQINIEQNRVESEELFVTFKKCEPDLCLDGTLLYRDDFGGNNPSDPRVGTNPIPSIEYRQATNDRFGQMGNGSYIVTKEGYCNGDTADLRRRYGYLPNWGSQWILQDDHTYPNDRTRGYYIEIDGGGGDTPFYSTTIDGLCPGSKLTFSAYVVNVHFYEQVQKFFRQNYHYVYPRMKFVLKNPQDGQILATRSTGDIQPDVTKSWNIFLRESADWQLVGMEFTVPEGVESIQMYIYNDAGTGTGNDFAMDDIEIHLCAPPITIEGDEELCANEAAMLTANFTNDGTFEDPLEYRWLFSTDSLTWSELTETSNTLTLSAAQKADSGWYKATVASAENIASINCRAISEPYLLKVKGCEPPTPPCPELQFASADTTVCDTLMPYRWRDILFTEPTTYEVLYKDRNDCDSVLLFLTLDTVHCEREPECYPIIVNKYNWVLLVDNVKVQALFPNRTVLAYQWYKNGEPIPGANEDDYSEYNELHGEFQMILTLDGGEEVCSNILRINLIEQEEILIQTYIYDSLGVPVRENQITHGIYLYRYVQGDKVWTEKKFIP